MRHAALSLALATATGRVDELMQELERAESRLRHLEGYETLVNEAEHMRPLLEKVSG